MTVVKSVPARAISSAERELAANLMVALGELARWSARLIPDEYSPGALSALATLVDRGPQRLGELASLQGVLAASMSRSIAQLEVAGLVERSVDPEDRRSSFVRATAAGTEFTSARRQLRGELVARQLAPLTGDRADAVREIVAAINAVAEA